jgi:hemoglobin
MLQGMTTIYEAAGGDEGLLRLAEAWHARVLADGVVAHAFSHGYRSDRASTTTTMGRYHESAADVPEGMSIPTWSWEGPTA